MSDGQVGAEVGCIYAYKALIEPHPSKHLVGSNYWKLPDSNKKKARVEVASLR